jgi:Undecaprenyl-phosphate galactose phosphotransferase WbaP
MASVTVVSTEFASPLIRLPKIHSNPLLCSAIFLASDACAIVVTGSLMLWGGVGLRTYLALWPALLVFVAVFAYSHLYPGIIHNAVTELRCIGRALTISFVVMMALLFFAGNADSYPRGVLVTWWLLAMVAVPLLRSAVRESVCRCAWWGIPVAIFHTGEESMKIVRELEAHPEIGLRPVVLFSTAHGGRPRPVVLARHLLPVLDMRFAAAVRACGVERAMIALPDAGCGKLLEDLESHESIFPHLMIMHSAAALYTLRVDAGQIGGCLAVDVRRDLLLPLPRLSKRLIDVMLVAIASPLIVLTIVVLGLWVRLESRGPIFYGHRRIGRDRSTFLAWKIRTMQVNGDELLRTALAEDEGLREEWMRDRKLRCDPRITRVGRFLRKTSLDELPQLWNVLRGEMSLVGPRPIVEEEVTIYGQKFSLYCRVTPGLTGLWQVSGRSTVGSSDRVRLDSYYVRNWSPWLDLYILARTAKVVFSGEGAY